MAASRAGRPSVLKSKDVKAVSKAGRSTVYNTITSNEKLKEVNADNLQLERDFLEYLKSTDRADTTVKQYAAVMHVFWCWNLENNNNKYFVDLTKREIAKFQNHAINEWGWSPRRTRTAKSIMRSLENYVVNILDDEYPDYKKIWDKIESPVNTAVREKTVLAEEEVEYLLKYLVEAKEYMKACFVALAAYSGRRKSELLRMKESYFIKYNLICDGALYKTPEKVTTKGRGRKGKLLYIYTLAKPFQPYLDLWLEQRKELGIKTDWLFPAFEKGKYVGRQMKASTVDSWSKIFTLICRKPFYIHSLRHNFVTYLSKSGIPDNIIKDLIGWEDVSMVDIYRDTDSEDDFGKYFGSDGIKNVSETNLGDL